jgi:hypothetical protein
MIFASNIYINHFQKYLLKNQVQIDFSYNQNIVKKAIYNEFVKQVFGDNTYFLKTIKDDAMFKKVVEIN